MSMPKFGQKAAKKEEEAAPAPKAEKPASDAPAKPRKLKQVLLLLLAPPRRHAPRRKWMHLHR
jgi:hypothetical protein